MTNSSPTRSEYVSFGNLDRRLTIRRVTETQSASGFPALSWADAFTDFCRVDFSDLGGGESYEAERQTATTVAQFTVRQNSNTDTITKKDRVKYDGLEWDIERKTEQYGRGRFYRITAKLRE